MIRIWILLLTSLVSSQVSAFKWSDLWSTSDQQGQYLMDKGQFAKAKEIFARNDWAAAAAYKAGDYERAAELFKALNTEQGYYNEGNALAHLGKYEQAIEAYNKALNIKPNDKDALYNRKLVRNLIKKDKEHQQNKDQEDQQSNNKKNQDQQSNNQQSNNQQKQDQQSNNQQKQDQQSNNQKKQDQQSNNQQKQDQQSNNQQKQDQQSNNQQKQDKKKQNQLTQQNDANKQSKKKKKGEAQSEAEQEKQLAKEQWLRLIPDDPGGLMREKFLRDHLRRERGWYQ